MRRRKLYNYTIANDYEYRELELFIPLNRIFVCDKDNRLIKYIPFEIVLTKRGNNSHCYYGANNTAIDLGDDKSGLISTVLQLELIKLRANINSSIKKCLHIPSMFLTTKRYVN